MASNGLPDDWTKQNISVYDPALLPGAIDEWNGPAAAASGSARKGKRKLSMSVNDDDEDDDDDDDDLDEDEYSQDVKPRSSHQQNRQSDKPKRKRNRAALSCTECKRRKVKCDRKQPCEACIKRGEPEKCHWSKAPAPVPKQAFALVTEHEELKARVAQLEAIVLRGVPISPGTLAAASLATQQAIALPASNGRGGLTLSARQGEGAASNHASEPTSLPDSDTEDAALVLEELALGRPLTRVGSKARKLSQLHSPASAPSPIGHPARPAAGGGNNNNHEMPTGSDNSSASSQAMSSITVVPLTGWRKRIMDEIWQTMLTNRTKMDWLLAQYFNRVDWYWHNLHRPSFLAEYEAFHMLIQQGKRDTIDPLWIAVLCATLCVTIHSLEGPVNSPLVTVTAEELESLPLRLTDTAEACLEAADWAGKPRFRTLQAVIQMAPIFVFFTHHSSNGEKHRTYMAAALRLAQQMGLHRLGDDPTVMPPEDYALPANASSFRRELMLRVFHWLVAYDYVAPRTNAILPPDQVTTAFPGNYNDSDLVATQGIVPPRPPSEATDTSWDIVRLKQARLQRRFNMLATSESEVQYSIILELEDAYQELFDELPTPLQLTYHSASETNMESWRRYMLHQGLHNRRLRLHRPFMSRGYREPEFRKSTDAAVTSARVVLQTQAHLTRAPWLRAGFEILALQAAIVVLFMNIWTDWQENVAECDDYKMILDQLPFLERCISNRLENIRKIAQQSLQLVHLLTGEVEKRRLASLERVKLGSTWKEPPDAEPESYGKLLKRIGAVVVQSNEQRDAASTQNGTSSIQPEPTSTSLFPSTSAGGVSLSLPANALKTPMTPSDTFLITSDAFPVDAFSLGGGISFDLDQFDQFPTFDVGVDASQLHLDHF